MKRTIISILGVLILLSMFLTAIPTATAAPLPGGVDVEHALFYGNSFQDQTTEANSSTTNDVTLAGFSTGTDVGFYVGMSSTFTGVIVDVGRAGASGGAVTWEYWNGSSWTSLEGAGFNDPSNEFKNTGIHTITFATSMPGWTTRNLDGDTAYWVRAHTTSAYGPFMGDEYPLGNQVSVVTGPPTYTLTVNVDPTGSGNVSRNPDYPSYDPDDPVQLAAYPNAGYVFDHWSGDLSGSTNPDTIIMDGNKDVTAHFTTDCSSVEIQLAMILDGSSSITSSNWDTMINGLADAVANSDCVPQDGTVELTVIQFGGMSTAEAVLEIGPVIITSANAGTIADDIRDIDQMTGYTPLACGLNLAADVLHDQGCFDPSLKQAINVVTDGIPNRCCDGGSYTEVGCPGCDVDGCPEANTSAVNARNDLISILGLTEGQDEIDAEFIGSQGDESNWLRDSIVWPQPGYYAPDFDQGGGWVRVVANASQFAATICEKFEVVTCTLVANAGPDETICEGDSVEIGGNPTASSGTEPYTYSWTPTDGLDYPNSANPNASPTSTTTYTVLVTDDDDCTSSDSMTVTVNPLPIATAPPITVCEGASVSEVIAAASAAGASCDCGGDCDTEQILYTSGNNYYTVNCEDGGCTGSAQGAITFNNKPVAHPDSNSPVCEGDTIELYGDSGMDSWSWTGPDGFTSSLQNPTIPNATTANAGTYTLTVTLGTCTSDPQTTDVTVNTKPVAHPDSNSPVCEGDTIELYGDSGMDSWSWTGPDGFTSSLQNPTIPNATTAMSGTYTLTVSNGACTSDPQTTSVTVNTKPVADPSSNSPVCEGGTIELYGAPDGMATYSWSGPGGFTSSDQNPTRTGATTAMSGTYTLTVSNGACTSDPVDITVTVNIKPMANPRSNSPVCEGDTIYLYGDDGMTGWSWSGPAGFTSSLQNPTIPNATTANAGTYTLTVTLGACTSDPQTTSVTVNAKPAVYAGPDVDFCSNDTPVDLTGTGEDPTGGTWKVDGTGAAYFDPAAAGVGPHTITYTYIDPATGCSNYATKTYTVHASPTATADSNSPVCEGGTIELYGGPSGMATYSWTGPGGFTSDQQNPTRTGATLVMGGTYYLTVSDGTCTSDPVTIAVTVHSKPVAHPSSNSPVCEGNTIQLYGDSGMDSWSWTGPDGFTSNEQNPILTGATEAMEGDYYLTVSDGTCNSDPVSTSVTVNPNPDCTITVDTGVDGVCANTTHTASVDDAGPSASYTWGITNGTIDSGAGTREITFTAGSAPGPVTLSVTVVNQTTWCGCKGEEELTVYSNPNCDITTDSTVCAGSTHTAIGPGDIDMADYAWTVSGGTLDSGQGTQTITYTAGAGPTVTIELTTTNENGCSSTCSVVVNIPECEDCYDCVDGQCVYRCTECETCLDGECVNTCNAEAGPNYTIGLGGSVTIGGSPTSSCEPECSYSWLPTTGLDDPTSPNPTASPTSTTTYTVTVHYSEGCDVTDSMTVTVTSGPPPGGGTPGPDKCYMIVDMLGERTLVEIDCCTNTTVEECEAYDENLVHLFELEDETLVQCGECEGCNCYPKIIVMSLSDETIEPPDGMTLVGPLYDFTGYKDIRQELACDLATYFDPTATVLLNYDPELLPTGASEPVIGFFSHADNQWVLLPPDTGRIAEIGTASGVTGVFASPFAVLASAPPVEETPEPPPANPSPAHFVASGLNITPAEVNTGEAVTISLNVANDGEESGTYTVELVINGSGIDSKIVTLGGGEDQAVSFAVSASEAGTYDASAAGLNGSFTVVKSSMWWIYLIIAAVVIILGLMALRFRRKPSK